MKSFRLWYPLLFRNYEVTIKVYDRSPCKLCVPKRAEASDRHAFFRFKDYADDLGKSKAWRAHLADRKMRFSRPWQIVARVTTRLKQRTGLRRQHPRIRSRTL